MRYLLLAFCGLLLAGGPASAATRSDPASPAPRQQAGAAKAKPPPGQARAAKPAPRAGAAARNTRSAGQRRTTTVQRATPVYSQLGSSRDDRAASASAACARVRGVLRCGVQSVMNWTQGLPPAAGVQAQDCPAGTMATLARGHDDVVRCMPI